ncbi:MULTISPECIES: hypothetical protein [Enterobacteriaceae]|uniref:hypothetical protein n=1 Tax=Enterobacteriaceae TaxID=543 RepID=UPI000FB314F0|nr:hypothetical protein [Enterobacter hormaechei]MDV1811069.1 hypothetical protein [Enterobacter hormaechei]MDV1903628.1 hypothetical protein [Enterobacter hormaechei]MKW15599.1 hypothetical protein [Salmonella enterica subsp. enterica]HEI8778705.1 hypothetical protein [Enterobacter cloacae]
MSIITKEWLQKTIAEFESTCDEIPFGMDEDDAKILQVLKLKLASMEFPPAPNANVDELTMWVKRLAHSLRNAKSGSKLPDDAMAYLSAKGLIGVEDALR